MAKLKLQCAWCELGQTVRLDRSHPILGLDKLSSSGVRIDGWYRDVRSSSVLAWKFASECMCS